MTKQFKEQGGAATMDPGPLRRLLTSRVMSLISKRSFLERKRRKAERRRIREGGAHVIEYFHQVEDGYSHLAAQVLPALSRISDSRRVFATADIYLSDN